MAGLLGSVLAGGVKGYAEGRANDIRKQEDFNLKMELQNAAMEKELKLKQAGIDMEEKQIQSRKDKVSGIANSVKDPMEGKGGYESSEEANKRNRGLLMQKGDALANAGEFEAAKTYYSRADQYDKTDAQARALDLKQTQIEGAIANGQERLRLQGEANTAKAEAAAAKVAASNNKESKLTDADKAYNSYVAEVKEKGKTPLSRYRFDNWLKAKNRERDDVETTAIKTVDEETGQEKTVTTKGRPAAVIADKKLNPWERGWGKQRL